MSNPPSPSKQARRTASLLSAESSDDEFFDADDSLVRHEHQTDMSTSTASGGTLGLPPPPRSISVTTIEGDPPDVEEDRDFTEIEELPGEILCCMYVISVESFVIKNDYYNYTNVARLCKRRQSKAVHTV